MIVKVARNGDKANNPLYQTFEVAEIVVEPMESFFSEAQALSRTAAWPPA